MKLTPIFQKVSRKRIKYIFPAVFLCIFTPLWLMGQNVNVALSPSKKTIAYGQTLEIEKIVVTEKDTNSFGSSYPRYDSIILRPINGYRFIEKPEILSSVTDFSMFPDSSTATLTYDKIKIVFETNAVNAKDSIIIKNLKLVPIKNAPSYGTSFHIEVIKRAPGQADQVIYNKDIGNYRMVAPRIELANYPRERCENDPFEMDVILRATEGTLKGNEKFIIKYCKAINNDTNALVVTEALSATDTVKKYKLGALTRYKNAIKVQADFGKGWTIEKNLTIGTGNVDIKRKIKAPVTFTKKDSVSASLLISYIKLNEYVKNAGHKDWDVVFEAENGEGYVKKVNRDYLFYPDKAGEGWSKVYITKTNIKEPGNYCPVTDSLFVNVYPNIITIDDIFCYGQNTSSTIKVAEDALRHAYSYVDGYKDPKIKFHSLNIIGQGDTLKTFYKTKNSGGSGFLEFNIDPTGLLEQALLGDSVRKDIEIHTIVNADVSYITERTISIDIDSSSLPMPGWACTKGGKKDLRCEMLVEEEARLQLKMASELSKIVIPRNDGHFLDFKSTYCQNTDSVRLKPNNRVDTITGKSIKKYAGDYFIVPGLFSKDQNTPDSVKLFYFDENGCTGDTAYTTTIHAVPETGFLAGTVCEGTPQPFAQVSPDSNWVNIKGWTWDFGDGFTLSNFSDTSSASVPTGTHGGNTAGQFKTPSHLYETPGKKIVSLEIMSEQGCKNSGADTIVIGKYPSPAFTFTGKLQDRETTLDNLSGLFPDDSVVSYTYTLTAPSGAESAHELTNRNDFTFGPEEYGVYTVGLTARSGNGCTRSTDTLLPVFPVEKLSADNFYFENFTGEGLKGWLPSQSYLRGHVASWGHRAVTGNFKTGKQTGGYMWLAGNPADSIDNETSWLESPCFDLSELRFPMVSLDIFESLESGRDGAALFYTLDDGETWHRVGSTQTGANWYNGEGIFNSPGSNIGKNDGAHGWSKDTTAWATARHPLDSIRKAGLNGGTGCVRFRIAYNSNAFHSSGYEGFAVDNFLVGKRKRVVLLEELINSTFVGAYPGKDRQNVDLEALDAFVDAYPEEVCDIRYHIESRIHKDPLFEEFNWQDNSARASEYGAFSWGPMWVMDGCAIKSRDNRGAPRLGLTYEGAFMQRGLVDPAFDISGVKTERDGGSLKITATIKKVSAHLDEKLGIHESIIRYAIVQKEYTDRTGKKHRNVMIDLLPTGVGNHIKMLEKGFAVGDEVTLTETWTPSVKNIETAGNRFRLIIYVQGIAGRDQDEIEQAWFTDLDDLVVPTSTKGAQADGTKWRICPNPVSDRLNLLCPKNLSGEIKWSVVSVSGQKIKQGDSYVNGGRISVPVHTLPGGMYILRITGPDGNQTDKAFSKVKD